MNFWARIKAVFTNRYEAAQYSGPDRSWLPALLQDARLDANEMSRREMARKIRYFERNLWLVRRLRDVDVKYSVGSQGMPVVPASSDRGWNKRMEEAYCAWCESPGRDTLLPMGQLHRQMGAAVHIDGEVFVLLTYVKEPGAASVPAIQLVESHRVENPGQLGVSQDNVVDGVQVNGENRPVGYWVRDGLEGQAWVFRDARRCLHVYDPERVGMYRAVTPYHASLNTSHDLDDLEILEMSRAKENAHVANVLETESGELTAGDLRQRRYLSTSTPATSSETDLSRRIELYKTILGSRTMALKKGEKLNQLANANPSVATQWLWLYKIQQVCVSVNVPLLLVFPESIQGTVARAILDDAHQAFRTKFGVNARAARAIYRHYANWARYNVKGLEDAPADWAKCDVIPPRACNVDFGRNSAATLAEYAAGVTSLDDIAGANGTTAEVLIRKKARNVKRIHEIAAEEGIEPAEISAPLGDVLAKLAEAETVRLQAEASETQKDEPKEEPKRKAVPA